MYHDLLLDHYTHPRNAGQVENPSLLSQQYHPSCGDAVSVTGHIEDTILTEVKFKATGCVLSVASGSILSELVAGKSIDFVESLDKDILLATIGIPLGPIRIKCVLLPLYALKEAIIAYKNKPFVS
ncbi:MAG TPA: iron-sulfur cluster assembly scaffold protein [Candidatus Babeliales bacterium]|jgi:nitrogen fixation NifU-like protein|nr:iron-sulfur cluster assembly scaffold protein [Candidatus Babeliales bacterium]